MTEDRLRVGIVAHRFPSLGGIQTCFMELIAGLNDIGIIPEVVWDEPQDWNALRNPDLESTFQAGRLGISSKTLRSLPPPLERTLRVFSQRIARLNLERYDFVYCFEPGVRMPEGLPNICWLTGPYHLRLPGDQVDWRRAYRRDEIRLLVRHAVWPLTKPDKNSRYVTHSDWIADLFSERYGFRPPVIWPPARSRALPEASVDRSGFLFLSRLDVEKRAESMLALARAIPAQRVTLAGASTGKGDAYVGHLRSRIASERLSNVQIVENPSESEVATLLTSHQMFVFPAHWEHFGIVTVEAIEAGLLPLVHDTGGQKEIVPFDFLRFSSDEELVECAEHSLQMGANERLELMSQLQRHAERGSTNRYREAMLQPLRDLRAPTISEDIERRGRRAPEGHPTVGSG